jgi:hypothetical protein
VSHGQAEDVADRIRRRLAAAGVLAGPAFSGPGWTADRTYQAGDRILFHTRCGDRHSPVVNGTVATVTGVDRDGLTVHTDSGASMVVSALFAGGVRADGTPNVSHAWARTVDGAQGGTWDHAHLLGSASLDAYRGYTGQSRSRHPTHTWNTTPIDEGDHGGRLAERRSAQQQVAGALARVPDTTMAALDDPWPTDRQLRAVVSAHRAALDRQPADCTDELVAARRAAAIAQGELDVARRRLAQTRADLDNLDRFGPLRSLQRGHRAERRQLDDRLAADQEAVIDAAGAVTRAEHRVQRLEGDQRRHDRFEHSEGWRRDAIATAIERLEAHWTAVAIACCRSDDPLAFGVEPLRLARHRLTDQLVDLDASLPAGRDTEQRDARSRLTETINERRAAEQDLTTAISHHQRLLRQRWPRRDPAAIGAAADHLSRAHDRLDQARNAEADAGARLSELDEHQDQRRQALHATAPRRAELTGDLALVDTSLDQTRPDRVLAAVHQPASWQVELLGPVPGRPAARAVWCDAAYRLETHLDRHAGDERAWRQACEAGVDTPELCAIADQCLQLNAPATHIDEWSRAAERARVLLDELLIDPTLARPDLVPAHELLPGIDM